MGGQGGGWGGGQDMPGSGSACREQGRGGGHVRDGMGLLDKVAAAVVRIASDTCSWGVGEAGGSGGYAVDIGGIWIAARGGSVEGGRRGEDGGGGRGGQRSRPERVGRRKGRAHLLLRESTADGGSYDLE